MAEWTRDMPEFIGPGQQPPPKSEAKFPHRYYEGLHKRDPLNENGPLGSKR